MKNSFLTTQKTITRKVQETLEQGALLAGIPQIPNRYMPTVETNLVDAEKRRNMVLQYMNRHGYISESEMKEAKSTPIKDTLNIIISSVVTYEFSLLEQFLL